MLPVLQRLGDAYVFSLPCVVSRCNTFPRDCECTVSQQLQETFEYPTIEEDGFLHGLLVRITLLAADSDVCLDGLI